MRSPRWERRRAVFTPATGWPRTLAGASGASRGRRTERRRSLREALCSGSVSGGIVSGIARLPQGAGPFEEGHLASKIPKMVTPGG